MKKLFLTILLLTLISLTSCGMSQQKQADLEDEINNLRLDIGELQNELSSTLTTIENLNKESELKSDYIELFQYLVIGSLLEGSLTHQTWQIYNDPDGIYPNIYEDELNQYKMQITAIKDKLSRLANKMESNSDLNIQGLPDELNTVSKIEDFRASLDYGVSVFEAELADLK